MLTERTRLQRIEIESSGQVFIQWRNEVLRDGVVIASIPHREPKDPNDPAIAQMISDQLATSKAAASATIELAKS